MSIEILLFFSILLYVLMHFFETVSISANIAGRFTKKQSQGISIQHSTFVLGRVTLPFLLLLLSYAIEKGIDVKSFLLITITLAFASSIVTFIVVKNINLFQKFYQELFSKHEEMGLIPAIFAARNFVGNKKLIDFKIDSAYRLIIFPKMLSACAAYFFLGSAFLISFYFAIMLPEYRLTISQFTTLFQGIGGLLMAFYVEPMFSKSLDNEKDHELWIRNFYSIMYGRLMSFLFSTFIFISIFIVYQTSS